MSTNTALSRGCSRQGAAGNLGILLCAEFTWALLRGQIQKVSHRAWRELRNPKTSEPELGVPREGTPTSLQALGLPKTREVLCSEHRTSPGKIGKINTSKLGSLSSPPQNP